MSTAAAARARAKTGRLAAGRLSNETLLHYAGYLPEIPRAILTAHLNLGMNARDLALLHGITPRQMRRLLERFRRTLADPCFLLAAQYGAELPRDLAALARGFWIENLTYRELAQRHGETLHRIRLRIALARSLLVIHLSSQRVISRDQACAVLGAG